MPPGPAEFWSRAQCLGIFHTITASSLLSPLSARRCFFQRKNPFGNYSLSTNVHDCGASGFHAQLSIRSQHHSLFIRFRIGRVSLWPVTGCGSSFYRC